MTDHAPKLLKEIELFSELTDKDLEEVAALAQIKKTPTDTTIFHEGDDADAVFVVVNGRVKIVTTSSDGKEFILSVLGAGQVFGEMGLLETAPRSASVVTITEVELLVIKRADFDHLLTSSPSISRTLMATWPSTTATALATAGSWCVVRPTPTLPTQSARAERPSPVSSTSSRRDSASSTKASSPTSARISSNNEIADMDVRAFHQQMLDSGCWIRPPTHLDEKAMGQCREYPVSSIF
jgi:signal-transduction protein with cAMP-binding, CBS, and nucleotidyltransferase domain